MKVLGWLLQLLLGPIFKWIAGWWSARQEKAALTKAQDNQAHADIEASAIRDKTDVEIEHAREQTDATVAAARTDAAAGDNAKLHDDIQSAIERANAADHL